MLYSPRYLQLSLALLLFFGLSGCVRNLPIPAERTLQFDICPEALATLPGRGAFQGYDGWFYFYDDLIKLTANLQEPEFVVQTKEALAVRGVQLIIVPLPSVGLVRPENLYLADPFQAAFSPAKARAEYNAYVETLRSRGLEVVDVLEALLAYEASGGQSFFKRDVHWTPEAAHAVAKIVAQRVRQIVPGLTTTPVDVIPRSSEVYYGEHINSWTKDLCDFFLPPEAIQKYEVLPDTSDEAGAEVVKTGSSFSVPPYDVGFLSVSLQAPVYDAAIGGGGMMFSLETYLRSDTYQDHRPKVIVWEYFVTADPIIKVQQRRLVAAAYGVCDAARTAFSKTYTLAGAEPITEPLPEFESSEHYLTFRFSDRKLTQFGVGLRYTGAAPETLNIHHYNPKLAESNSGRFFTTLAEDSGALTGFTLEPPAEAVGEVTVNVCQTP